jgi:hypothetical protein
MAVVLLVARLVAPAVAMPVQAASPFDDIPICHAAGADEQPAHGPEHPSGSDHDCPACSMCCLASHVDVPASQPVLVWEFSGASVVAIAVAPPPTTGPPRRVSLATPPTGPPSVTV